MANVERDFDGKVAIVTGAASGLGQATAVALGRRGAAMLLVDMNATGLAETAALLPPGASSTIVAADLGDPEQAARLVEQVIAAYGRVDVLCNVAGICRFEHATAISAASWDQFFAINVRAPFLLIQAALPYLIESEGAVVNVASAAAFIGQAYLSHYAASKAALVSMTKSLAMEFLRTPVRINAVAPGGLMTPMAFGMLPPDGVDPQLLGRYLPIRGMVELEDLVDVILMLAGPRGRAFHGACLNADQGMTAG